MDSKPEAPVDALVEPTRDVADIGVDYSSVTVLDLDVHERALILEALRRRPTVRAAAPLLNLSRFALGRRMRALGIAVPRPGPKPAGERKPRVCKPKPAAVPAEQAEQSAGEATA